MERLFETLNASTFLIERRVELDLDGEIIVGTDEGEKQFIFYLKIMVGFSFLVAVSGITSNILNIRTFYYLGINDGISVSFFTLSISDMSFLLAFFGMKVVSTIQLLEASDVIWFPTRPLVVIVFLGNIFFVCSSISMFAVTFLAVARCLCVAMPLHFKHRFTKQRCVAFFIGFTIISMAAYIPIVANTGVQRKFDRDKNATRIFLWFTPQRERIKDTVWLIFDTILPVIVQVTLIISVVVMVYKLRESAAFRQQSQENQGEEVNDKGAKLNSRDRRVVLQVLLISIIYVIANSPKIFNSLYTQVQPEFDLNKRYHFLYFLMSDIRFLSECVNATANFFVYFNFNSAFRKACFSS